jgi:hypothetical protein
MTTTRSIIPLLIALLWMPALATETPLTPSPIAKRLDAMLAAEHETLLNPASRPALERAASVEQRFQSDFAAEFTPSGLAHHDEEDLSDLLRAASMRSFYSNTPETLAPMRAVVAELDRRGALRHHHALTLHGALLQFRRFDEASELAAAHALEVPILRARRAVGDGENGRRIWAATSNDTVEERRATLGSDIGLVMIAQPHCGFSKRAMAAISANPRAIEAFANHALVLVPQSAGVDARAVHRWNTAHPELTMLFVDAETDWPEIEDWETPVFHLLRDGKPAETVVGWPDDSRLEAVLRLLDDASAVTAQSVGTDSAKNARTSSSDRVRANGGSESKNVRP